MYSHGGSGGGSNLAGVAGAGGNIVAQISTASAIITPFFTRGSTIVKGGDPDVATQSRSSDQHILGIMSPGFGGSGGGANNGAGSGAGGDGFRGSGGGGGGGAKSGTTAAAGGRGGNGYVAILAIN